MLAALRIARRLRACLMLLFICSVGAAMASPWLASAGPLTVVCSGQGGLKLLDATGDAPAGGAGQAHSLDCPLCLPSGMTPPCEFAVAAPSSPAGALCAGAPGTLRISVRVLRPPARAPPLDIAQPLSEASS